MPVYLYTRVCVCVCVCVWVWVCVCVCVSKEAEECCHRHNEGSCLFAQIIIMEPFSLNRVCVGQSWHTAGNYYSHNPNGLSVNLDWAWTVDIADCTGFAWAERSGISKELYVFLCESSTPWTMIWFVNLAGLDLWCSPFAWNMISQVPPQNLSCGGGSREVVWKATCFCCVA